MCVPLNSQQLQWWKIQLRLYRISVTQGIYASTVCNVFRWSYVFTFFSSGFVIKGYQERQNNSSIIVFLVVLLIFIIITLSILISIMLNSYMLSREQREYKRYVKVRDTASIEVHRVKGSKNLWFSKSYIFHPFQALYCRARCADSKKVSYVGVGPRKVGLKRAKLLLASAS